MSRLLKLILAANLIVIAVLAFAYPHLMVSPGKLIPGHTQLETDCFACHTPVLGATSERCISCHEPDQIGRLTSAGLPIEKPLTSVPFHQELASQDCVVCHSDHSGVRRYRQHGQFKHSLLQKATLDQCQSCHKAPVDPLHEQISGTCSQCHSQEKWAPATFDHDKYFELDRDHTTRCVVCHERNDYRRYTCYGCHEHTPGEIRREHIEEGIRNFKNCVECHRNANEDDIRGEFGRSRKGGGEGEGEDEDD